MQDRLKAAGSISEGRVFQWGLELCETLAFVHGKGIVHHDIKPANILFAADGTIKLGDFGVANLNIGTIPYLPPEMLLKERVAPTDARVDVYALGLTLLESLTGQHPFVGLFSNDALQARIAHDFIPAELPRWVQEVLLKATHPTPELRFQTAADFGEAIRAKHVAFVFDPNRIQADGFAKKADQAIARRRWKSAQKLASAALHLSGDCVSALLAGGRCQLLMGRIEKAQEQFTKALAISPRTQVQKELGWISLEQMQTSNPFIEYNRTVGTETPAAWTKNGRPSLKGKLLFQEYQFGVTPARPWKPNTLVIDTSDGVSHEMKGALVTIGSLPANDVVLRDESVSRRHCVIVNYPGDVWLYDLDSTSGTRVDGQPLVGRMLLDEVHDVDIGRARIRITPDRRRLFGS